MIMMNHIASFAACTTQSVSEDRSSLCTVCSAGVCFCPGSGSQVVITAEGTTLNAS